MAEALGDGDLHPRAESLRPDEEALLIMKQEIKDIAINLAYQAPTSVIAWWKQLSLTTAIAIILGLLQIAYLIRKWVREETEWGRKLKRWADGVDTKPGEL
jgi:hypothetical protein